MRFTCVTPDVSFNLEAGGVAENIVGLSQNAHADGAGDGGRF